MINVESAANSWVFGEARRIVNAINHTTPSKGYVLFETGYGPSGLPHIGTFGEVVRTAMVMHALRHECPDIPMRLFVYSDDMDGLRKIPDNVPNPNLIRPYLGFPLTSVPDPFGKCESYGSYMNSQLRAFLDRFGFSYEFKSSTDCYRAGVFNDTIKLIMQKYEAVKNLVLPILGQERQKSYHPIIPICKKTGKALITEIVSVHPESGDIVYIAEDGEHVRSSALNGGAKMQWKIDWGMRWRALGVNYEMHGKDLDSSAEVSAELCKLLGSQPPVLYRYEMYLDAEGKKISKSKGNGVSVDDWLRYAPVQTLMLYMYTSPHKSRRLSFDSIPKTVDEYLKYNVDYFTKEDKLSNPLWHIHSGNPPNLGDVGITFSMMLNLACACHPSDAAALRCFIDRRPKINTTPEGAAMVDQLIDMAFLYYTEKVKENIGQYRKPDTRELIALRALHDKLLDANDDFQEVVLSAGEVAGYSRSDMKPWFKALYQILFNQESGPRMGTFISLYGADKTAQLIEERIG